MTARLWLMESHWNKFVSPKLFHPLPRWVGRKIFGKSHRLQPAADSQRRNDTCRNTKQGLRRRSAAKAGTLNTISFHTLIFP